MQVVVCAIEQCGYRSKNGFCLNRVVSIGLNGVCKWVHTKGWTEEIAKQFKSIYNPWEWVDISEDEESRESDKEIPEISTEEAQDQKKDGKDGARVD